MASLANSAFGLVLLQLLFYIPSELVVLAASVRLFDIRRRGLFLALSFGLFVANTLSAPYLPPVVSSALGTIILVVPQLLFSRDSFARKVFTAAVMQVAVVAAEVPPSLYWVGITDVAPTSVFAITNLIEYLVLARILHVTCLAVLFLGVEAAQDRITGNRTDRGSLIFVWFFVLQYLMMALGVYTIELTHAFSKAAALGLSAVCGICLVSDVVCFVLLDWYNRQERETRRVVYLQHELRRYLEAYREIEGEVSLLAQVRHDLRNHMNVIRFFVEQGNLAAAKDHLAEMVRGLSMTEAQSAVSQSAQEKASASLLGEAFDGAFPEARAFGLEEGDGLGEPTLHSLQGPTRVGVRTDVPAPSPHSRFAFARKMVLAAFPVSQIATAGFLFGYAASAKLPGWFFLACLIMCLLCFIADIVLFHFVNLAERQGDIEMTARLLEEQAYAQRKYYERLEAELVEARGARQELRLALENAKDLLAAGDARGAEEFFGSALLNSFFKETRYCQNSVVNALVSIKAASFAEEGIRFECSLCVPEDLPVPNVDLCALFSNMLDNALHACRRLDGESRYVRLRSSHMAGVFAVSMENSCSFSSTTGPSVSSDDADAADDIAWDMVRLVNPRLSRRRSPRARRAKTIVREHGWGLQILRDMAERYSGSFDASLEGDACFHTAIMLVLEPKKG